MRRNTHRISPRLIGAVTALIALLLLTVTFTQPTLPWSQPLHLKLAAGDFGQVNTGEGVDLGGIKVGTVDGVDYQDGHAVLLLSIKPQFENLVHADAAANIRPYGLLGPKHVEIEPGEFGQMKDGAEIPLSRTSVSTDLQQVLNTLQPDVRNNLKVIFVELGTASDGRGQDMHAALQDLGEASADLNTVTSTVRGRDADVAGIIDNSEIFNRDIQNAPIAQQIADTDAVLTALVQVENNLGDGIDQTASVLIQVHNAVQGNEANLRYVLAQAPATVQRLEQLMKAEGILVTDLSSTLPSLMTAVMETKSAFSYQDGSSHYVRVQAITGPCNIPSCSGKPTGPHGTGGPSNSTSSNLIQPNSPSAPSSSADMISFLIGS